MLKTRGRLTMAAAAMLVLALSFALAACSTPAAPGGGTSAPPAGGSTGGSTGGATGGTVITEANIAFNPTTLTVKVGETVTFKNQDSVPHNVSIDNQTLGVQQPGQNVTWTPKKAGSYPFKCLIHPTYMTGVITVQ